MLLPIRFDVFPCIRFDTLYLAAEVARSSFIVFSRFEEIPKELFISTVAGTYTVHLDRTTSSSHSNPMAIWTERRVSFLPSWNYKAADIMLDDSVLQ